MLVFVLIRYQVPFERGKELVAKCGAARWDKEAGKVRCLTGLVHAWLLAVFGLALGSNSTLQQSADPYALAGPCARHPT